jgi:hypothetical protein
MTSNSRQLLSLASIASLGLLATGCTMDRGLYYKSANEPMPTDYVSAVSYRPADAGRFDVYDRGEYTPSGWAKYKKFWGK